MLALYPVLSYYLTAYLSNSHEVLKPGSNFVYAGSIGTSDGILVATENITYIGNGRFKVVLTKYLSRENVIINYITGIRNPGKIHGQLKEISTKTVVLTENDPLIKTLFPEDSINVSALNWTKSTSLSIRQIPFSSDFSPASIGFPFIYAPNLPPNLSKSVDVSYYRGRDRYFARVLTVISPQFRISNVTVEDGLPVNVPIGVTPAQVDLPEFLPGMVDYSNIVVTHLGLLSTNVQPAYQDWVGGIEYSFTQYTAPVDYALILMGIVLLILAGRMGR